MIRAFVAIVVLSTIAYADADQDFRAAGELAAKSDPRALDAFEAIGNARPISRWTDDAWVEAARIAERTSDFDRARTDLERAIAISTDAQLVRRAKTDLARIVAMTGGGQWNAVAAEHQRLVTDLGDGGDPTPALKQLEALAKANPAYPRGAAVRIALARAWETEDEVDRALGWLRDALPADAARIELVRMLIRHRRLDEARTQLPQITDAVTRSSLERALAAGESHQLLRYVAIAVLALLAGLALGLLHRRSGGWRPALRRLARPPAEVIYFVPIASVVGFIALTGNPLVGKAVLWILIGAALIAWLSGATLEAQRQRAPVSMQHAIVHALVVGVAVIAAVFLAIDHARLLDLVAETWRTGPGN